MMTERTSLSLTLLLVGVGLFLHTYTLGFADLGSAFSPVFFPRIILSGWIVLAILSLIADVVKARAVTGSIATITQWWVVLIFMIAIAGYIALLEYLGFFASSALFSVTALVASGQRKVLDIVLFSLFVPGALVVLFNHVLTMPLPVSTWYWWI